MAADLPDYYAILQVSPQAQQEVIEAAYRRLARMYHPDMNSSPGANQKMVELNQAYAVLSNPNARADYDRLRTEPGKDEQQSIAWDTRLGTWRWTHPVTKTEMFWSQYEVDATGRWVTYETWEAERELEESWPYVKDLFESSNGGTHKFWRTPLGIGLRWVAVLPFGIGGAILVMFPIHWSILLADWFSGGTGVFWLLSNETIERLMISWTTPFSFIVCGAWTAPSRQFEAGVALALLIAAALGGVYVFAFTSGAGLYSLHYGATPVLNIVGLVAGLLFVRNNFVGTNDGSRASHWN